MPLPAAPVPWCGDCTRLLPNPGDAGSLRSAPGGGTGGGRRQGMEGWVGLETDTHTHTEGDAQMLLGRQSH